jgi:uncharacterized protein (TIGR02246 family)
MRNSVVSAFRRKIAFKIVVMTGVVMMAAAGVSAQTKPAGGDEAAIVKIRTAFQTAAGTQDGAAIAKLFAPDGVEMAPNAPAAKGRAAIEAFHKAFGQQYMMHGMTITSGELKVHGDTAHDVGTYKQTLMAMKGGAMTDDTGKYVVLLKKDASGAWWITHAIYNSDVPLPAAPAKK